MAVTTAASGTKTATGGGTTDNLANINVVGTYQLYVDLNNMVSLDTVLFSIKAMVLTGGTSRYAYDTRRDGAQPAKDLILISVPISTDITDSTALVFELTQTNGTGKAFPWKIIKF